MYCNGLPERNIGFIPYVQVILHMLENESLAIEPKQLTLKLDGGREMNKHGIDDGINGPGEEDGPWAEGWDERNKKGETLKQLIEEGEMNCKHENMEPTDTEGHSYTCNDCGKHISVHDDEPLRYEGVWEGGDVGDAKEMEKAYSKPITEGEMKEKIEGDVEIFEEMGKQDPREVYKESPGSRSLLSYNMGKCPCCDGDMWVKCKSKDDIEDYTPVCDTCGYVDNK